MKQITTLILAIILSATLWAQQDNENELHGREFYKPMPVLPLKDISESVVFANQNISDQSSPQNEPTVRISRVDPNIVVAAWRDFRLGYQEPNVIRRIGYSYSHDGGLTWSDSQLLPDPNPNHLSQSDPVLTSDSQGYFYLSSTSRQPVANYNREMLLYRSIDNGETFHLHAVAVPGSGSQGEDKEWIFTDPVLSNPTYDNIFIIWRSFGPSYGIKFRKSSDHGSSWTNTVSVSDVAGGQGANIASGTNGEIYAVWLDYGILFDKSTDEGATWGNDRVINYISANNHYSFPFITVDYSNKPTRGNIYVTWADKKNGTEEILFQRSTDGGQTWLASPIIVNDVPDNAQYWPVIKCDTNGNLAVVYYDERQQVGQMSCYLAVSSDQGNTWSNMILNSAPFFGNRPNNNVRFGDYIGVDFYNGKIIPVWTDDRTFDYNQEIYSAVVDINVGISTPVSLTSVATLNQNKPNPFTENTTISITLEENANVELVVFNSIGEKVADIENAYLKKGEHEFLWNASGFEAGIYFFKLNYNSRSISKKMVKLQ